jgi:hypothetical protein
MLRSSLALCLLLALGAAATRPLDRVLLRDGGEVSGHLLLDDGGSVVLEVKRRERTIPRAEISEIVSPLTAQDEFVERALSAREEGRPGWAALLAWAREHELEREAELAALGLLRTDWDATAAHELLGSKQRRGEWQVDYGGQRLNRAAWDAGPSLSWSRAAELETSLYELRSNADVNRTLEVAVDLARGHQAWFAVFGDELRQRHRIELFEVAVHGDGDSYPGLPGDPLVHYDAGDDRIQIDATRSVGSGEVHHEVAHQLLAELLDQAGAQPARIPAWLDEGLAEVLARMCSTRRALDASAAWLTGSRHFAKLRDLREPPSIGTLMGYRHEDFHGADDAELRYAQAYSLVVFCLGDEGDARRRRFLAFIADLIRGKADPDRPAAALGYEPADFERRWRATLPATEDSR